MRSYIIPVIVGAVIGYHTGWLWSNKRTLFLSLQQSNKVLIEQVKKHIFTENQLKESEERLKILFEYAPLGYQSLDSNGYILQVNQAWLELMGYERDEVIGKWFGEFIVPWYRESFVKNYEQFKNAGKFIGLEYKLLSKDKNIIEVAFEGKAVYNDDFSFRQSHCLVKDITHKKKIEKQLYEREERLRCVVENMPVLMYAFDKDWNFIAWNSEAETVTGYQAEEIIGNRNAVKMLVPDHGYRRKFKQEWLNRVNDFRDWEWDITCKDGTVKTISWSNISKSVPVPGWASWGIGVDITVNKKFQMAIQESEEKYRSLIDQSHEAVFLLVDHKFEIINDMFLDMFNIDRSSVLSREFDLLELIAPSSRSAFSDMREKFLRGIMQPKDFEFRALKTDGNEFDAELSVNTIMINGRPASQGIVRDITARNKALHDLKITKHAIDNTHEPVFWVRKDASLMDVNKAACEFIGMSHDELLGKYVFDLSFGHTPDAWPGQWEYVKKNKHLSVETIQKTGYDELLPVEIDLNFNEYDGEEFCIVMIKDISARKKAQQEIIESEKRFRLLFESANDAIFIMDGMKIIDCNPPTLKLFNCTREDLVGKTPDVISPIFQDNVNKSSSKAREFVARAMEGEPQIFEWVHTQIDGTPFDVEVSLNKIDLNDKIYIQAIVRDITERKRSEELLRETKDTFQEIADLAPQAMFEADLSGMARFANKKVYEYFGYLEDDLKNGIHVLTAIAPDDRKRASENIQRLFKGEKINPVEYRALRKDGTEFPVEIHAAPILKNEVVVGIRGIIIDITDRKKNEFEQIKAEKMKSIGILAGGIAHDFNNILTAILGNISFARMETDADPVISKMLSDAENATVRAKDLTQQLLTFSKGGDPVKQSASIIEIIKESASFLLCGSAVKIFYNIDKNLNDVIIDTGQIGQVIYNLIINAKQAMNDNGLITVSAANITIGSNYNINLQQGDYVKIEIADNGDGIDSDNLGRIFDPYFTTKPDGNGLGLATAYSIISKHDGYIHVESQPGIGTSFILYLPAGDKKRQPKPLPDHHDYHGIGRILVMDDEEIIRDLTYRILTKYGYTVQTVPDGDQAVSAFKRALTENDPFEIVILDLTIPGGMGGKDTIIKLKEIDPHVIAIVSSGYSNDPVMASYKEYGFHDVVTKPYHPVDLVRVVHSLLPQRKPLIKT